MMTLALAHQLLPGSTLVGDPSTRIERVHTDTRSLQAGDLFVALQGEHFDGHSFLGTFSQALSAGSPRPKPAASLIQQGLAGRSLSELGLFGLEIAPSSGLTNTRQALGVLAKNWRAHLAAMHGMPLIAVTGSNGKTTLTQMTASILQAWKGEHALATVGNFNNDIGVPLTLLRLRPSSLCAVVELGMNHVGEIAALADMAAPTVAVINNAQREHQEFMQTVEAVARENGAVIEHLAPSGTAVFPADDAYTPLWRTLAGARPVITFGWHSADVTASSLAWQRGAWQVTAATPQGPVRYALHMAGRHNVKNSLAAVAACLAAGVPLAAIEQGLSAFTAVAGRSRTVLLGQTHPSDSTITLVDDTYNANPDSVLAAIDMLMDLPAPRLLILGDMGEVGDQGVAFHAEVGAYAKACGIEHFWTLGELCRHAGGLHFESLEPLLEAMDAWLESPASILVKGSRFMKMERIVQHLEKLYRKTPHAA